MTDEIPEPVRGGTFLYCPFPCRIKPSGESAMQRFRKLAAYRRHFRKHHAGWNE